MKINVFWFRRDLRIDDNTGLQRALMAGLPVLPVFIFDNNIIDELSDNDPRITFIYRILESLNAELNRSAGSIYIAKGDPVAIWKKIIASFEIHSVYINRDYEPYSIQRDNNIETLLKEKHITLLKFKDQVIFETNEILKPDNKPYTIFTPYSKQWIQKLNSNNILPIDNSQNLKSNFYQSDFKFPSIKDIGYTTSSIQVRPYDLSVIREYQKYRDIPSEDSTSYLSPHLRFGTISIRKIVNRALDENRVFLNELIWREFFMQILFNYPQVITSNFKSKYNNILWRNNEKEFERWCNGETGYPIVDAGMRQLNETGYMHNRVRMITAGFLCKHLLIDWQWGEAYFARKLLDYELSSNNGNWQWAAGTGSDAVPYFRLFNPYLQQEKFDRNNKYILKWCNNFNKPGYPQPIVDHVFARNRALEAYRKSL